LGLFFIFLKNGLAISILDCGEASWKRTLEKTRCCWMVVLLSVFFSFVVRGKGKDDSKFLMMMMMMMMMRGIHTDATPYLKAERHTRGQSKTTTTTLSR
jgi:hypothetical protein